ncbi:MAG: hypothetical protein DMF89_18945 [Acidobacteria bacterium]|nr:MAG: hypothetical protein DMF89_18945 [Acidobacteriota bacterium]
MWSIAATLSLKTALVGKVFVCSYNSAVRLSAHGVSHPGRRASNEDALFVDISLGLFIVADGMGGHNAGEVAAHLAVETISEFILHAHDTDRTWPYGFDPALSVEGNRVCSALRLANDHVRQAADSRVDYAGMGTTVVVSLVSGERVVFGGVGDSRVYLCQQGTLHLLTQDDSWVAMVREAGHGSEGRRTACVVRRCPALVLGRAPRRAGGPCDRIDAWLESDCRTDCRRPGRIGNRSGRKG